MLYLNCSGPVEFQAILNFPMAALFTIPLPSAHAIAETKFIGSSVNPTLN